MRWSRTKLAIAIMALLSHKMAVAEEPRPADPLSGSSVSGVVRFNGPIPKRKPIALREKGGKMSDCRHLHEAIVLDESLLVSDQREIANVFVYVKKGLQEKDYPLPKQPAVLNQVKCTFQPRLQGVRIGQEFSMKNSDPLLHNVRLLSFRNRPFNVAQPAKTPDRIKVFTLKEKAVKIQCDIHPWMTAYVFMVDHPFFAVTDDHGRFKINGLPPGEYLLEAWHEELGDQRATITVEENRATEVGFAFEIKDE